MRETVTSRLSSSLVTNPQLADVLVKQIDDLLNSAEAEDAKGRPAAGQGPGPAGRRRPRGGHRARRNRLPQGVQPYDETVTSERILAVGDLYYIYQHEKIGVFRVVQKLQELFRGGAVRLSTGEGAYALYQFDRREVLRYTRRDRQVAYRRVLGYGNAQVPAGSRANTDFHNLFSHLINQVTLFWRDKRISDVIRERAYDPSFGSIAIVRRAGLDLRNNLKFTSFGHLNVLRVEVMQLLDEAFRILNTDDIKRLFGADKAWDVVEDVLTRHFNERLQTSPRQRMGVTGREVLRWLAQPHILQTSRPQFEALLLKVAEHAEEWLTSAQSLGLAQRNQEGQGRVLPWDRPRIVSGAATRPRPQRAAAGGSRNAAQEY